MTRRTLALGAVVWLASVTKASPCIIIGEKPTPQELLKRSDAIVRVMASDYVEGSPVLQGVGRSIAFKVVETLKGNVTGATLVVPGNLVEYHDPNDGPVPYQFGRRGSPGGCFAFGYRKGASCLFLLKKKGGDFTPYWQPLVPVNEEVTSDENPWLLWVRQSLSESDRPSKYLPRMLGATRLRARVYADSKSNWEHMKAGRPLNGIAPLE